MTKQVGYKHLNGVQVYKLMRLLEAHYTEKGVTDEEFAKWVTQELGFTVNRDHVYKRRTELEIPATRVVIASKATVKAADMAAMMELVRGLEERVVSLEKIAVMLTNRVPKA